jgi:hypothetical protein
MNDAQAAVLFLVTTVMFGVIALALGASLRRERRRADRAESLLDDVEFREQSLERLQATVDCVAIEVERIGEIERFAVERLAARPSYSPTSPPRVVTPH